MITEKSVIKTEAIFSEDRQYRYVLRKEWDKNKKRAMVLMINPSYADLVVTDMTTMYVVNNLHRLDFGGVDIVNLFSAVDGRRSINGESEEAKKENAEQITTAASKVDVIIIAWGKAGNTSKAVKARQDEFLEMLAQYEDKVYIVGFHPLSPYMRVSWNLKKYSSKSEISEL